MQDTILIVGWLAAGAIGSWLMWLNWASHFDERWLSPHRIMMMIIGTVAGGPMTLFLAGVVLVFDPPVVRRQTWWTRPIRRGRP